jgi:hypothetical protein
MQNNFALVLECIAENAACVASLGLQLHLMKAHHTLVVIEFDCKSGSEWKRWRERLFHR